MYMQHLVVGGSNKLKLKKAKNYGQTKKFHGNIGCSTGHTQVVMLPRDNIKAFHRENTTPLVLACSLYLVEFQHIEQIEKLPVLLLVKKLDIVLLEAVERQLCLVVHVDL